MKKQVIKRFESGLSHKQQESFSKPTNLIRANLKYSIQLSLLNWIYWTNDKWQIIIHGFPFSVFVHSFYPILLSIYNTDAGKRATSRNSQMAWNYSARCFAICDLPFRFRIPRFPSTLFIFYKNIRLRLAQNLRTLKLIGCSYLYLFSQAEPKKNMVLKRNKKCAVSNASKKSDV